MMEDINNSAIKAAVQKRMSKRVTWYLVVGLIIWIFCIVIDLCKRCKICIYDMIECVLSTMSGALCEKIKDVKYLLAGNLSDFSVMIVTLDTILAAAVIFFYSVQDNEKEGIPNRTIMTYSFGSFTVPVLFVITMVMLPVNQCAIALNFRWTAWAGLILTYIIQMTIVVLILLSTSYQYSVYTVGNAEIRQFRKLDAMEKEKAYHMEATDVTVRKVYAKQNPFFIWTYLLHHLEQVVLSDELIADKMELARRLLRAPFYLKEIKLRLEWTFLQKKRKKRQSSNPEMSLEAMKSNSLRCVYQFYYGNLVSILQRMSDVRMQMERNKIYLVLYEFMEELTELYEMGLKENSKAGTVYRNNYLMSVCGIINAVMDSGAEDAEGFCVYVFNNIVSKGIWRLQFSLYILFQEYLYRTNKNAIRLDNLESIDGLRTWKFSKEEKYTYIDFWNIWAEFTTLPEKNRYIYFNQAFCTLTGEGFDSKTISYVLHKKRQLRKEVADES